jgi:hypothetical protein
MCAKLVNGRVNVAMLVKLVDAPKLETRCMAVTAVVAYPCNYSRGVPFQRESSGISEVASLIRGTESFESA